ncbi:deoxyribose-phosphate aldolase [Pseudodesulfovibrio sp.]|uniref:deoxyribose-phosphate aldolase n=1 Tax=unclassified Pseudodesulfovibrio TaxID=2661612 RepID=UPI003B00A8CE
MADSRLAACIDHTLLKPDATRRELEELCSQAGDYGFYGVCVNPSAIARVACILEGTGVVPVCVVGFPLGASLPETKAAEAAAVTALGARELDMVLNIGAFKDGDDDLVHADVAGVVRAAGGNPVKVILETALLSGEEIVRACRICVAAGASFVKTSTGFGPGGATEDVVRLMRRAVGPDIGVKASGGIHTREQALAMIEAGANRIGASASIAIVRG